MAEHLFTKEEVEASKGATGRLSPRHVLLFPQSHIRGTLTLQVPQAKSGPPVYVL